MRHGVKNDKFLTIKNAENAADTRQCGKAGNRSQIPSSLLLYNFMAHASDIMAKEPRTISLALRKFAKVLPMGYGCTRGRW